MSNKFVVIATLGGFAVGATASYFVTKRMVEKFASAEIAEVKATYKAQYEGRLVTLGNDALKAKLMGRTLTQQDLGLSSGEIAIAEQVRFHIESQLDMADQIRHDPLVRNVEEDEIGDLVEEGPTPESEGFEPTETEEAKQIIEDNLYAGPSPEEEMDGYTPEDDVDETSEEEFHSIYDYAEDREGEPYAITSQQYNEHLTSNNWESHELTYYEGDDVLADAKDAIPNPEMFVGEALTMFGTVPGSGRDEVFVRNERLEADYHITRLHKSYTEDVLRIRPSSKMSKFLDDDE